MLWEFSMPGGRLRFAIRVICALPALAISSLMPTTAQAQPATAQGSATVAVVAPLTLVRVQDLDFGRIAARPTAGTVTIDVNNGGCTATGGLINQGTCRYAEFAGRGTRRMRVRIQIPTTVTITGPTGATMLIDTLALGTAPDLVFIGGNGNGLGNGNRRYEISSPTGIFTFRVAGRLNVGANQAPGVYSGTFPVTVQYQ